MREQQPRLRFQASSDWQDQGPSSASAEEKQTSGLNYIKADPEKAGKRYGHGARVSPSASAALRSRSSKQANAGCPIHRAEHK